MIPVDAYAAELEEGAILEIDEENESVSAELAEEAEVDESDMSETNGMILKIELSLFTVEL